VFTEFERVSMNPSQTIYIVDDDEALCRALSWLLESVGLTSLAFHNAYDFLKAYQLNWRGCLLIDIRMPEMSGLQLQEKLIEMGNLMPIIMISGHGDISMAVRAMKAGAQDFITKPFNDQLLLEQIQASLVLNRSLDNKQSIQKNYQQLTPREQQILSGVVAGKMNKEIAYDLNISHKTVELHRSHVMQKMGAKTLAELIKMSYEIIER
jgi:FixJ family two-component response regulator